MNKKRQKNPTEMQNNYKKTGCGLWSPWVSYSGGGGVQKAFTVKVRSFEFILLCLRTRAVH